MAGPTFFDDQEFLDSGMSLPNVEALRRSFENSSSNTTTFLNLDQAEQLAIDANAISSAAMNLAETIQKQLNTLQLLIAGIPNDDAAINKIAHKLSSVELLAQAIDYGPAINKIERRLDNVEILANGNNLI